ncbi:MAG: UDP-N-acetyl-alpha-D-glucosamine C6 dehydratase [Microgenomates bacterium OLB22]|nr:MAG: UDP-N-acetyl-alpha-D-glucosamine C6 dehydratase [Microgenomates bacterium OLB22]
MSPKSIPVLIVGAGNAGRQLLREFKKSNELNYCIVGFLDDDPKKKNKAIRGIPVIGTLEDLEMQVKKNKIKIVFIAFPSVHGGVIRALAGRCKKIGVECRIIPKFLEIIQNKVRLSFVRPVTIDDLVGRPIIKKDQIKFLSLLKDKKVLVTGAAGSIGSELVRQINEFSPRKIICGDQWETGLFDLEHELKGKKEVEKDFIILNIQDRQKMDWVFKKHKPDYVFHAAAYKHVPLMDLHPEEAVKNNIIGTKNVAYLAGKYGAEKFTFISTDKAVNPSSVMGATKSFCEALLQYYEKKFKTVYCSVRFGNVLGSYGSVVPLFQKQIAKGGPVTVTHPDMKRFFMTIPEAVQLVLHASRIGKGGEIFLLEMGEQMKILDLANTMIRLSGLEPGKDIQIKITGIRPGEKLYEELFAEQEELSKTDHDLIYALKNVSHQVSDTLLSTYARLKALAKKNDRENLIKELRTFYTNLQKS